ncbi:hypothetical protein J2T17_005047 [Paenibacillus mucilaginosus]|uniref:hypothetical protein n=1 Tax=Paenibacillus mucilaginosus TaxID=61624 RepID=UPI003D1FD848
MKWMKSLIKLGLTAAVTSVCCVALTFLAVNTYVEMLLDQYHIQRPAGQKIDWGGFAGRFSAQLGLGSGASEQALPSGKDLAVAAQPQASTAPAAESGTTSGGSGGTGSGTAPGADDKSTADPYRKPDDAVAVWSRQSSSQLQGSGEAALEADKKVVVSGEEFNKLKDALSESDKTKVFGMLYNRVPPEEMQKISLLLEDGITAAEIKELEQVLQRHLKEEEYKQLLGIIEKQAPTQTP